MLDKNMIKYLTWLHKRIAALEARLEGTSDAVCPNALPERLKVSDHDKEIGKELEGLIKEVDESSED